jgi:hypothetical protein
MNVSYKRAEAVREGWFLAGLSIAILCIPAAAVAVVMAAWESLLLIVVLVLAARQMMSPAVHRDGWEYKVYPVLKLLLHMLFLARPH